MKGAACLAATLLAAGLSVGPLATRGLAGGGTGPVTRLGKVMVEVARGAGPEEPAAGPLRAEDWPQWRGPNRDGVWYEAGVLETFPRDVLKIRWRAAVGPGWSSPVVAQGRVYLTDSHLRRPKAEERVLCFDETNGNPLWTHVYEVNYPDWAFTAEQNGCPCATPLVKGKILSFFPNALKLQDTGEADQAHFTRRIDTANPTWLT